MRFCPDANALIARLVPVEGTAKVDAFWDGLTKDDELIVAPLFLPECTSVLRRKVHAGVLTHEEAMRYIGTAVRLPLVVSTSLRQFPRAMEIAERRKLQQAYDMQYLAVAELEQAELVTLDGGLRQAAIEFKIPVRFLR